MAKQIVTDEELRSAALELHTEGGLTVRALRQKAGGDWARVSRVAREVRDEAAEREAVSPPVESCGAEEELAACIKADMERLERNILMELAAVRRSEHERSRQAERAAAEQHETEIAAAGDTIQALRAHVGDLEDAAAEQTAQIEAIESELTECRDTLCVTREEQRMQVAEGARERLALAEAVTQTQAESASNAAGRRKAEAAAEDLRIANARIIATLNAAEADLEELRERVSESRAALGRAEQKKDSLRHDLEEKTAEIAELTRRTHDAENRTAVLTGRIQEIEAARQRVEAPSPTAAPPPNAPKAPHKRRGSSNQST